MRLIYLVLVGCALSGCSPILLDEPQSPSFAVLAVGPDDNQQSGRALQLLDIKTADGQKEVDLEDENPRPTIVYLKAGQYLVRADCTRNWPNPPAGDVTYRLPHGLGTDDASEVFAITVEAGKDYLLDCKPGLDKSDFELHELIQKWGPKQTTTPHP